MRSAGKRHQGFTLIELMLVVAILGILASVALPAFVQYLYRSRSVEATQQLNSLYNHVRTYYAQANADPGLTGNHRIDCVVGTIDNQIDPGDTKQNGVYSAPGFRDLGYTTPFIYYNIGLENATPRCFVLANTEAIYTLRAVGDLDGDDINSTFELYVGSNGENEMYHARGFHTVNDLE